MFPFLNIQSQTIPSDSIKEPAAIITETIKNVINTPTEQLIANSIDIALDFGVKILAAIVIYTVGLWIIKKIKHILKKLFEKKGTEQSLSTFILSFTGISCTILLIITTISVLGINTTSFVALLAGSGLAIGMALSGTLQNFAGGIMILVFKPFKVGDYIEAQGFNGTVQSIEITCTHITTPDNKKIILPNGSLSNGTINNYSATGIRRCQWDFGVEYGTDLQKCKDTLLAAISQHPMVINDPEKPYVVVTALTDTKIDISARAWVNTDDYWTLFFDINEKIYNELPKNGINFASPRLDIKINNKDIN